MFRRLRSTEVPVPSSFGLPYDELALETPDHVNIRAYLMVQRKDIAQGESVVFTGSGSSGMSDHQARIPSLVAHS